MTAAEIVSAATTFALFLCLLGIAWCNSRIRRALKAENEALKAENKAAQELIDTYVTTSITHWQTGGRP